MTVLQALKNQLLQTEEERNRYREETQAYQAQLDQKMNQLAQMQEEVKITFFYSLKIS
jgi:ABC-type Zn2+ transport system substrate-binding protein/surface adhesin